MMRPEMEHTSGGPETLDDEACVLTREEWEAIDEVVLWAMAVHKTEAEFIDLEGGKAGRQWFMAAQAMAARTILLGAKERTHHSHYPLAYPTGRTVVQHATVNV